MNTKILRINCKNQITERNESIETNVNEIDVIINKI